MGNIFSDVKRKVIIVGLDNAGKSTLINKMQPDAEPEEVTATVGFREERFRKNSIQFTVFDMSGQGRYRDLWQRYYD